MTQKPWLAWLPMLLVIAGLAGAALSWHELRRGKAAALTAAENLAVCEQLAARIMTLRDQPGQITAEAHSTTELAKRIEKAALAASIPNHALVRIDPQPARRLAGSNYKEQPTSLDLQGVTLRQVIELLKSLNEQAGLEPTSLRLSVPRQQTATQQVPETWAVQLTLTGLVFAPKSTPLK